MFNRIIVLLWPETNIRIIVLSPHGSREVIERFRWKIGKFHCPKLIKLTTKVEIRNVICHDRSRLSCWRTVQCFYKGSKDYKANHVIAIDALKCISLILLNILNNYITCTLSTYNFHEITIELGERSVCT